MNVMGMKKKGAEILISVIVVNAVEILMGDNTALMRINALFDEAVQLTDGVRVYLDSQDCNWMDFHFLKRAIVDYGKIL
jgi:hypothetical protein